MFLGKCSLLCLIDLDLQRYIYGMEMHLWVEHILLTARMTSFQDCSIPTTNLISQNKNIFFLNMRQDFFSFFLFFFHFTFVLCSVPNCFITSIGLTPLLHHFYWPQPAVVGPTHLQVPGTLAPSFEGSLICPSSCSLACISSQWL